MGGFLNKPINLYREKRKAKEYHYNSLSDEEKLIHDGRKNFIVNNISTYIIISVCAGSYLAGLINYAGVPIEYNGLILSIPVLATVFQFLGAVVARRISSQKKYVVAGVALQRICLSTVFLYPLILGPGIASVFLIIATYTLGHFVGMAVGPSSGNWLMLLVPKTMRAEFFSKRERYSLYGIAFSTVLAGIILDISEGAGFPARGFAGIGVFLFAVSITDILHLIRIYEPSECKIGRKIKIADIIEPFTDKSFLKVIIIMIMWQASAQIAMPFLGIYYITEIGIEYSFIGAVIFIITIEKAVIVSRWGRFADRTSWENVLKIAMLIFAAGKVFLVFLSPSNYIWLFPLSLIIGNVAWSVLGIALINIQYMCCKPENTVMYVGVSGSIGGLAGFLFAFLGSRILSFVDQRSFLLNGNQVLLILSGVFSVIMSIYIHGKIKDINRI